MKITRYVVPALVLAVGCVGIQDRPAGEGLTLQRIFSSKEFEVKRFGPARWLEDDAGYTTVEDSASVPDAQDIVRYDPQTGRRRIVVSADLLVPEGKTKPVEIKNYAWSRDGTKLLIFTNAKRVWRTETRGDYWVLDLADRTLRKLGGDAEASTLMFAKFSPQGDRVAYVRERNIYVERLGDTAVTKLTTTASDTIINGTSDWVYEEEFRVRDGFRWSPDGTMIAYWQFDDAGVRNFHLINNTDELYPTITSFPYPKVGQQNPACRVGVVNVGGGETRWIATPGDARDDYIPKMAWVPDSTVLVLQQLNRLQNRVTILRCEDPATDGSVTTVMIERDDAWVDLNDSMKWLEDGSAFTWLSERDGWRRLYLIARDGAQVTPLTPGEFDVMRVDALDEKGGWVYFTASPDDPTRRYLYRAPLDGSATAERITPAGQPGSHTYTISPDARWAFHTVSTFDSPPATELIRLPGHERVRPLEENAELRSHLEQLRPCPVEFFRLGIGDGVLLDAWCITPPDFDSSRRYPVLFYVYGEPAGQTVLDRWGGEKHLWHRMLAQQGYIVVSVDNRGTPAPRGRAWRKCVYRRIGILASSDQARAARALLDRWPYADPERIAIWGWSGGGQMSLNAIFRYPEIYSTAMAIAFISDQRLYDTIYQERYMGLPDANEEGYRNGSPLTFAKNLQGNLLLVHGTGDDNCHYQSCEVLINELIKHNKPFTMMAYPNRTHAIKEGENTKRHLFELLTRYLTAHTPPGPQ